MVLFSGGARHPSSAKIVLQGERIERAAWFLYDRFLDKNSILREAIALAASGHWPGVPRRMNSLPFA